MHDDVVFGEELRRLRGEVVRAPDGVDLRTVRVEVVGDPAVAAKQAGEVLASVLSELPEDWPSNTQQPFPSIECWARTLPGWFVDLCAPEMSESKITATSWRLHRLPMEVRDLISQNTAPSLGAWISCFEHYRSWVWWGVAMFENAYELDYVVFDDGYTRWDLNWLLVASGGWRLSYRDCERF